VVPAEAVLAKDRDASVEFRVVMTPDDLQKAGLDEVGKKWAMVPYQYIPSPIQTR
jgi:hypothetical protein